MTPEAKMILQDLLAVTLELQGILRNVVEGQPTEAVYRRLIELDRHSHQVSEGIRNL